MGVKLRRMNSSTASKLWCQDPRWSHPICKYRLIVLILIIFIFVWYGFNKTVHCCNWWARHAATNSGPPDNIWDIITANIYAPSPTHVLGNMTVCTKKQKEKKKKKRTEHNITATFYHHYNEKSLFLTRPFNNITRYFLMSLSNIFLLLIDTKLFTFYKKCLLL